SQAPYIMGPERTAPAEASAVNCRSRRRSVALTCQGCLQLPLVHLRAPLDAEALRLPIELFLGPILTHSHNRPPFESISCRLPHRQSHKRFRSSVARPWRLSRPNGPRSWMGATGWVPDRHWLLAYLDG